MRPMGPTRMLLSKPVIAAIAGYAVAGGLELALWCDLRVMEEDAVLGVFCRRWGVPLIDGGTVRLPRLIGLSRALDLILTGRPVGAEEALAMGLANRVVPKGQARRAAEALAHELARFPQTCLRNDRLSAYEQFDLPLARGDGQRAAPRADLARRTRARRARRASPAARAATAALAIDHLARHRRLKSRLDGLRPQSPPARTRKRRAARNGPANEFAPEMACGHEVRLRGLGRGAQPATGRRMNSRLNGLRPRSPPARTRKRHCWLPL